MSSIVRFTKLLLGPITGIFLAFSVQAMELYGTAVDMRFSDPIISPDQRWAVWVRRNSNGVPMLTLSSFKEQGYRPLLFVQKSGWVLWAPDSARFVFTDAAFSNRNFIRVCSAAAAENQCEDFSPALELLLRQSISKDSNIDEIYMRALRWESPSELLVGVHAISSVASNTQNRKIPVASHYRAYSLDLASESLMELDPALLRQRIGRTLDSLDW